MKLGEILVTEGLIDEAQLERALNIARNTGQRLGYILIRLGQTNDRQIAQALARQLGIRYINISEKRIDPDILNKVTQTQMEKYVFIPLEFRPRLANKPLLYIAIADPTNIIAIDEISLYTNCEVRCYIAPEKEIAKCLHRNFGESNTIVVPEYSLDNLFKQVVVLNASFALLEVGSPPKMQKKNQTTSLYAYSMTMNSQVNLEELSSWPALTKTFMRQFCEQVLSRDDIQRFIEVGGVTINYAWQQVARFRIDVNYNSINLPQREDQINYEKVQMRILLTTKLSR